MKPICKRTFIGTSIAAMFGFATCGSLGQPGTRPARVRIGTYDSRAIAIAAINSQLTQDALAKVRAEHEKAKATNDTNRMAEIEARMNRKQRRQHEQGFSTGSVMNLLAVVSKSLPELAKRAGVELITSKWEVTFQSDHVEVVDVTDDLVKLFNPSEKALRWIRDIKPRAPTPLDELP